jgi:O-6-methylguanine DNA methyltransferase
VSDCAVYPFPFGRLKIGYEGDAVTLLKRTDEPAGGEGRTPLTDLAFGQISEYLEGRRREFDFPYLLRGTEFQQKVWRALCAIPYGETRTYGEIAAAVGNPRAARAVGMANHENKILIAVPCHRVIGADGSLVGYGSGLDMKQALLRLEKESVQREN